MKQKNSITPTPEIQPEFNLLNATEIESATRKLGDLNIGDPDVNIRILDPETVSEYAGWMEIYGVDAWQDRWEGEICITESNDVWSGNHTASAALKVFGEDHEVRVQLRGKTKEDARLLACQTNWTHGRKRSNAEKRETAARLITQFPHFTDGLLAELGGLSQPLIGKVAQTLQVVRPDLRTYFDKSGKPVTIDVGNIGKEKSKSEQELIDMNLLPDDSTQNSFELERYEREQLISQISLKYEGECLPYFAHPDPIQRQKQEGELILSFRALADYPRRDELDLDALRQLIQAVGAAVVRIKELYEKNQDEIRELYNKIRSHLMNNQDEDARSVIFNALSARYDPFRRWYQYNPGPNQKPYHQCVEARDTLSNLLKEIQIDNGASHLPADYKPPMTDAKAKKKKEEVEARDKAEEAAEEAVEEAQELILSHFGDDFDCEDVAIRVVIEAFNAEYPKSAFISREIAQKSWLSELEDETLNQYTKYWNRVKRALAAPTTDGGLLEHPMPAWFQTALWEVSRELSHVRLQGYTHDGYTRINVDELRIGAISPLTDIEIQEVFDAAAEAAREKMTDIHLRRTLGTDGKEE